jgi:hypothetical protein
MMNLMVAVRCKINSRRLSRYIDRDPAAPLNESEIRKVKAHLVECEKCTAVVNDFTTMKSAMRWLGANQPPDESGIERLKHALDLNSAESDGLEEKE